MTAKLNERALKLWRDRSHKLPDADIGEDDWINWATDELTGLIELNAELLVDIAGMEDENYYLQNMLDEKDDVPLTCPSCGEDL